MNVLVTGDLSTMAGAICKQICHNHKVIFAGKEIGDKRLDKKAEAYSIEPDDPMFPKLFASFCFHTVVFLAACGGQTDQIRTGMLEKLESVLRLSRENNVTQVLFLSSTEVYAGNIEVNETVEPAPDSSRGIILAAGENLCKYYRSRMGLNTVILRIPYLYGENERDSLLARMVTEGARKGRIVLPGRKEQACDFIHAADVAALIGRLVDDPYHYPEGVMNIGSGRPATFEEVAALIKREMPGVETVFPVKAGSIPIPVESARKYYDWTAVNDFVGQLPSLVQHFIQGKSHKKTFLRHFQRNAGVSRTLLKVLELMLGFLLMEYLNSLMDVSLYFRFIDFRLLYVVIMGSTYGMRSGTAAAILAGVSCLLDYVDLGLDWRVIVYNIDNWIPFVSYLAAGTVTGYTKDKETNRQEYDRERFASLEERYAFLYKLYEQTLKNKEQIKSRYVDCRQSFGRIYDITRRLDSMVPDAVLLAGIQALEDILENQSIAIYTVEENGIDARLAVRSKSLKDRMDYSIRLSQYSEMMDMLQKGEVWCNKKLLFGYPAFCASIYDEDRLSALIMVWETHYEQMALYYINQIKVLCGLIQAALTRASKYNAAAKERIYFRGTHIVTMDRFQEILAVKKRMKEDGYGDFQLLCVENQDLTLKKLEDASIRGIRKVDTIGQGEDGRIYIILSQAGRDSVGLVCKRLENMGIRCSHVESADPVMIRREALAAL